MVIITVNSNGFIFDASALSGAGETFSKKIFYPFNSIASISMFNDRVVGTDLLGKNYEMTIIPTANMYPVSSVGGVAVTTIEELYNELLSLIPA